jgi:hypothetical protein
MHLSLSSRDTGLLRAWPYVVAGLAALAIVYAVFGAGILSLPGMLVLGPTAAAALLLLIYLAPEWLAILTPMTIALAVQSAIFPYEAVFALLIGLVVLQGIRTRADWLWRLGPIEIALLLLIAWSVFTGFWIVDLRWYLNGIVRIMVGFLALWVGLRLRFVMPRRIYELGLILGSAALSMAALAKRFSTGLSNEQAALRRAATTDLGWGTANYIAALLLLLSPVVLYLALHSRDRLQRLLAWPTMVMIAVLQGIIASRAAGVLFVFGTLVQVFGYRSRRSVVAVAAVIGGLIAFLVSPLGQAIILRFTSLREIGSMAVRIWYFRVAWHRVLEFFPWGMGLSQGWTQPDRLYGRDPHNYWFVIVGELGLPGLVLWIAVLVLVWRAILKLARDPATRGLGQALQVSFWLGQLHTLVEPTYQGRQYQYIFFWLVGGFVGYAAHDRMTATRSPRPGAVPQAGDGFSSSRR